MSKLEDISNEFKRRIEGLMVRRGDTTYSTSVAESKEPELTYDDILQAKKELNEATWQSIFDGLSIDPETHTLYLNPCHKEELPAPPEGWVEFVDILEENQVAVIKDFDPSEFNPLTPKPFYP